MSVWAVLTLLGLTAGLLVESAVPDPPTSGITTVGSLKLATAEDCAGVVAFSANQASNTGVAKGGGGREGTVERSFSRSRRIKTSLTSTILGSRLNGKAAMSVHRKTIVEDLEEFIDKVVDKFAKKTEKDGILVFAETTINKGVGYIAKTGIFTTHCPGLYQFSFAGYGSADLRISLKRKLHGSDTWTTLVGAGPGGGANLILINAEAGDQFVVYVDAGKATEGTTFAGYRFAKK